VPPALLYRCPNPTNWLCPCGRVARELRRHDVDHETVRVPYRRRDRAEVEELTGQRRVPVLVIEDEAIVDSRRIVEHLRWRASAPSGA
jgi:glutathione S-transferase